MRERPAEEGAPERARGWSERRFEATLVLIMGDKEAKRIILARRARFVAAALAGLNAAMCGGETDGGSDGGTNPRPCLSPPSVQDGGPKPCLSPPLPDAAADADGDAEPQPCLAPPPGGDAG